MDYQKIAELAGCSISTVSKAFSYSRDISEETRKKIFAIAKKDGSYDRYSHDRYAQPVIATVLPEFKSEYYAQMIDCIDEAVTERGGIAVFSQTLFDAKRQEHLFNYHANYQKADGVILIGGSADCIKNAGNVPAVLIGEFGKNPAFDYIGFEAGADMLMAIDYLVAKGHKDIGFIGEKKTASKMKGFANALEKRGLSYRKEWVIVQKERFEDGGYQATKHMMHATPDHPTAILAAYDRMAIGAARYLSDVGLSIPENISLMGMDNIAVTAYTQVAFTTIGFYHDTACKTAVDLIYKKLDNHFFRERKKIIIDSHIIERESVKEIRKEDVLR